MTTTADLLQALKKCTNAERLDFIEAAFHLIRSDLRREPATSAEEQDRRLRAAAERLRDDYEAGGELTEWSVLDGENILDDDEPR